MVRRSPRPFPLRPQFHPRRVAVRELDAGILKRIAYERFLVGGNGRLAADALGTLNDGGVQPSALRKLEGLPPEKLPSLPDLSAGDHHSAPCSRPRALGFALARAVRSPAKAISKGIEAPCNRSVAGLALHSGGAFN